MLHNKWTFSLMSFVVLLAFGLVSAVPSVFADGRTDDNDGLVYDLDVTISAAESMIDVDARGTADDIQISTGRDRASREFDVIDTDAQAGIQANDLAITLLVVFSDVVNLAEPVPPAARLLDIDEATANEPQPSHGDFGEDDLFVAAYDNEGRSLGVLSLAEAGASATGRAISQFRDAGGPGRQFLVQIDESQIVAAYVTRGGPFEIYSMVFFIPRGIGNMPYPETDPISTGDATATRGIRKASLDHAIAHFGPGAHHHLNNASNQFRVDLVDDDEGNAAYHNITGNNTVSPVAAGEEPNIVGNGTPGVVAINRILNRSGFRPIETGPFDLRIILTEEPRDGFTAAMINVVNGTAGEPVRGLTYKGGNSAIDVPARTVTFDFNGDGDFEDIVGGRLETATIPTYMIDKRDSDLNPDVVDYYFSDGTAVPLKVVMVETGSGGYIPTYPEATGRDNKYHEYSVTITPNHDLDGEVTVSINQFSDNVLPIGNQYLPLTREQMAATTLGDAAENVRDARGMNETITVRAITAKDTTSDTALKLKAGEAAYETRQQNDDRDPDKDISGDAGVFNNTPTLDPLGEKLVIPAMGYLVLVRGADQDGSGVLSVSAALKQKLTDAQKAYNIVYEFELPHPAVDLEVFFRNGGMISIIHGDLPDATDSGTDQSKASHVKDDKPDTEHADYTGYDGATTKQYAAGDVVISEVMWGSRFFGGGSQYIELHNTTDAAITIDYLEWAIAIGSTAPTGFTVLDTVGNNPATGYWPVPGADFDIEIIDTLGNAVTRPAVSMSRVSDATSATGLAKDGTAEASWQSSTRRDTVRDTGNTNITQANMVGTPGAANAYVEPAPAPTPAAEPVTPPAAVATAGDLRITEIMVASNEGRFPQWIEITNVSTGEVSLMGWVISIANDSADAVVVASSLGIKLDGVTLDAGQSALVVSKMSNRNSGVAARAKGDANAGALDSNRIVDAQSQVDPPTATYSLISEMAFQISLQPPLTGGITARGDVAGNLGGGWDLEMAESGRSSIIRREMGKGATAIMGTDAAGWVLASNTGLGGAYVGTFYGDKDDVGTPGYNAGGALPVELSKFSAARDRVTGQVIITWETQSELNNAGFFVKRSQQRDSKFVVVNPTMIPGAGTTAEKQSYTYSDTTAQPNVVYYYQIEDVSLDGNRQTLTRGHRLKGHIGAAGKATTTWGDLKSSRD